MIDAAPAPASFLSTVKSRLARPRMLLAIGLALSCGAALAFAASRVYLKPLRAAAEARYRSHEGLMRLYDLQLQHYRTHGVYANDLDALLRSSPDGAGLRAKLDASVDLNTLAVLGDARRFRLEANVLDAERTSVKIRGPLGER